MHSGNFAVVRDFVLFNNSATVIQDDSEFRLA